MSQFRHWSSDIVRLTQAWIAVLSLATHATAYEDINDSVRINDFPPELAFFSTGVTYAWSISADSIAFVIRDAIANTFPFKIVAGAPDNSFTIAENGRVGMGAFPPAADLHISTLSETTTLRMQSRHPDYPSNWELQAMDATFALVDVTTQTAPLIVGASAPTGSLIVQSNGDVGIGVLPEVPLHVRKTSQPLSAETISKFHVSDDNIGSFEIRNGSATNGIFHPRVRGTAASQAVALTFEGLITTDLGPNPVVAYDAGRRSGGAVVERPLVAYRNNGVVKVTIGPTGVVTATSFNPVSSRARKHDIEELDSHEAANALRQLAPVKYVYNDDESNQKRLGFIAEDVPEVVAAADRKSVPIMDVAALVARVVKDQQQTIEEQKKQIEEQRKVNDEQRRLNELLMKRLSELEKVLNTK